MTGWEPIVVKPLIILRQIKTVETERDALLRPSEEGIRPVVVHPTKRSDFSRHGYRVAQFEDAFARFLPHEPNIRTLKSGRERT
jgi:hypothetical protein